MKVLSAFLTLLLGLASAAASPAGSYRVVKEIPVPGSGSWDYLAVDEAARRFTVLVVGSDGLPSRR